MDFLPYYMLYLIAGTLINITIFRKLFRIVIQLLVVSVNLTRGVAIQI